MTDLQQVKYPLIRILNLEKKSENLQLRHLFYYEYKNCKTENIKSFWYDLLDLLVDSNNNFNNIIEKFIFVLLNNINHNHNLLLEKATKILLKYTEKQYEINLEKPNHDPKDENNKEQAIPQEIINHFDKIGEFLAFSDICKCFLKFSC